MADVLEVRITPPFDELDTSSSSSCQDEMDWDDAQDELACLQVEIPYHRVLSPISGLTEGFSSGLQLTESPCPSDSEYVSSFLSTASGSVKLPKPRLILTDASDKENHENIIHSPSPTKARSIAKLEVQALEYSQEEPPAKSPRGEDEEEQVNPLYQSDPGDLKHLLRESVPDPRKLHASLPDLPAYDGTHSGELKLQPKTRRITRNRSNTGPRIRPPSADNNASPHGTRSSSMRLRKPRSIQQLTKSRPSSPSVSPISSPSLTDRHSFLSESVTANGAVKQPRKISALIPTLAPIPTNPNTLKPRRESLTKSPRGSPRSSLRASSNILLEASPKRSANWPRSALLRSEGSLPTFPPFPLEARPRTAPGYPFIDNADQDKTQSSNNNNHNNNKSKLRGPSFGLIKSQLVTLQGDFSKDFHFTNESANQSEGEQPEAFDLEKEEEEEEEEEGFGRTLRRSVSEMDIGQALSNQRKRKLSRRKGHQSAAPCYGASFQSHCDRVRAEQQICQVPTVVSSKHPDLDVIEAHTLMKMLRGEYADCFSGIHVIDCRFPYEYDGGHVVGAFNLHTPNLIETHFPVQKCDEENEKEKKPAIIFHCEFSSERGPKQYRHLRKLDREMNYESYPKLYYPHLFLLAGGYKEFFLKTEGELCEPRNYVEMLDTRYSEEMKRHTSEAKRRSFKKFRSQSYSCLLEIMNK